MKADSTVEGWGFNDHGQTTIPVGLSNVIAVAAGHAHSLALKSEGTVVAWGYNSDGQASVPTGLSNVTAIAAGAFHSLALTRTIRPVIVMGQRVPGLGFQLTVTGEVGREYILQGSTNLLTWFPILNFACTNLSTVVVDPSALNHDQLFYRVAR